MLFFFIICMLYRLYPKRFIKHLCTAPFIYSVFFPTVLLDIVIELYHRTSFPMYGLPYVSRSAYIKIDRQRLSYLPWYDKLHCMYCGYVNGFLLYAAKIAQETEKYWCAIKHQKSDVFLGQEHQQHFFEYGDQDIFDKLQNESKTNEVQDQINQLQPHVKK